MKKIFFIIICLCAMVANLSADEIKEVVWVTPEWEAYVQKDGKGLYNEIIFPTFESGGIKVKQIFVPWKRAEQMVRKGTADMYGGLDPTDKFPQSKYPISVNIEAVTFLPEHFGQWKGLEALDAKKGVWARGYIDSIDENLKKNLRGEETSSREGALRMVELGRCDYYFDNTKQTNITFSNTRIDRSKFRTEIVSKIFLYMTFANNDRGKYLKQKYDAGIEHLIQANKLKILYDKYDEEYPIGNRSSD